MNDSGLRHRFEWWMSDERYRFEWWMSGDRDSSMSMSDGGERNGSVSGERGILVHRKVLSFAQSLQNLQKLSSVNTQTLVKSETVPIPKSKTLSADKRRHILRLPEQQVTVNPPKKKTQPVWNTGCSRWRRHSWVMSELLISLWLNISTGNTQNQTWSNCMNTAQSVPVHTAKESFLFIELKTVFGLFFITSKHLCKAIKFDFPGQVQCHHLAVIQKNQTGSWTHDTSKWCHLTMAVWTGIMTDKPHDTSKWCHLTKAVWTGIMTDEPVWPLF